MIKKIISLSKQKTTWIKVFSVATLFLFFTSYINTFAIGSPYTAGETLDPACAPGEVNCIVEISGGSSYTFETGLTDTAGVVTLGGALNNGDYIDIGGFPGVEIEFDNDSDYPAFYFSANHPDTTGSYSSAYLFGQSEEDYAYNSLMTRGISSNYNAEVLLETDDTTVGTTSETATITARNRASVENKVQIIASAQTATGVDSRLLKFLSQSNTSILEIIVPDVSNITGTRNLPLSVNGNFADAAGDITVAVGGSYTFNNGLTEDTGVVKLGGPLDTYTTLGGINYSDYSSGIQIDLKNQPDSNKMGVFGVTTRIPFEDNINYGAEVIGDWGSRVWVGGGTRPVADFQNEINVDAPDGRTRYMYVGGLQGYNNTTHVLEDMIHEVYLEASDWRGTTNTKHKVSETSQLITNDLMTESSDGNTIGEVTFNLTGSNGIAGFDFYLDDWVNGLTITSPSDLSPYNYDSHYLPISVNGNYADATGNITVAAGGGGLLSDSDFNTKGGTDAGLNFAVDAENNTLLGFEAGKGGVVTSAADHNTGIGTRSLYSITTGYENTANGMSSLYFNTTGDRNTANGSYSLFFNTSGSLNSAIGEQSLYNNTTGSQNTASGTNSLFLNTTGSYNTASGYSSLRSNTTGNYNTANGYNSVYSNTTGSYNTADGYHALYSNVSGSGGVAYGYGSQFYVNNTATPWTNYNTSVGYQSLRGSTTAANNTSNYNTAIGYQTLYNNTSGTGNNTAVGYQSLYSNTNGVGNTATGANSLYSNIGHYNTAYGAYSLYSNWNGTQNAGFGHGSLFSNTSGGGNTGLGYQALTSNTTGSYNTAGGLNALRNSTTGGNNSAFGFESLHSNVGNSRSTAIGFMSMYYADDRVSGRSTYNTAIGYEALKGSTTAASNTGQYNTAVGDSALFSNTTGYSNVAIGANSLYSNTTGGDNNALGDHVLYKNISGYHNVGLGQMSLYENTTGSNNISLGYSSLHDNTIGGSNISLGSFSLANNINGNDNIAFGYSSLFTNTSGNYNISMGQNSLYYNTTGSNNISSGYWSLYRNTIGNDNIAFGYRSLYNNTEGNDNIAIGNDSAFSNTTGYQNLAIGKSSFRANTTGYGNVATGHFSLYANTTGVDNTAVGNWSLYYNDTGSRNTSLGSNSLQRNTIGNDNTGNGYWSLFYNTIGEANTSIGSYSLHRNIDGNYNLALGYQAGRYIATGSNNTTSDNSVYIGSGTRALADNDQNEIVIGYNATGRGSNTAQWRSND